MQQQKQQQKKQQQVQHQLHLCQFHFTFISKLQLFFEVVVGSKIIDCMLIAALNEGGWIWKVPK